MILSFFPDLFAPPILQKRAAPLVWVFFWVCSILFSLAVDLGWPPALLYGLIGIAEKRRPDPGSCAARHGDSQSQCEVIGNPDFYGLGIRLGIYLQWFSALLALPAESKGFFESYFVFTFALFVMFFVLTFGETASSCVFTVELIIMQFIFFGGMYIMIMARVFRKAGAKPHSGSGLTVAFELLLFPIVLYGCWFWIRLAQGGNVNPFAESPCGEGTTFFLLARVTPQRMTAASGFMAFVFVYTQLAILFCQLGRAIGFFGPLYNLWANRKYVSSSADAESAPQAVLNATQQAPSISGSQRSQPSLTPSQRRIVEVLNLFDDADAKFFTQAAVWMVFVIPCTCYMVLITGIVKLVLRVTRQENKPWAARLRSGEDGGKEGPGRLLESIITDSFVLLAITLSVLVVELTLLWNSVTGVYDVSSVGQLIPLAIGIGTLGQVLWKKIEKRHEGKMNKIFGSALLRRSSLSRSSDGNERTPVQPQEVDIEDIEIATSFQLQDGRWMSFPPSGLPQASSAATNEAS